MNGCEQMGCSYYIDKICTYDSDICLYRENIDSDSHEDLDETKQNDR